METREDKIREAQRAYDNGTPIMSDAEFDALAGKDGAPLDASLAGKVKHKIPMLSQGKCHSYDEVFKFVKKTNDFNYSVTMKMDGLSCSLVYENGILKCASTRGNGDAGEDITRNVKAYVNNLPVKIPYDGTIEIRGEIVTGIPKMPNARNVATGMCARRDKAIVPDKVPLKFFAWDLIDDLTIRSESEKKNYIQELGFAFVLGFVSRGGDIIECVKELERLAKRDDALAADGIVIKCCSPAKQAKLGVTAHHPKYSIAYKFAPPEVETTVNHIEITFGAKTGKQTPVAHINPVMLDGAVVKKVSLGSMAVMSELGIKEGSRVMVARSGGVIPHITKVLG